MYAYKGYAYLIGPYFAGPKFSPALISPALIGVILRFSTVTFSQGDSFRRPLFRQRPKNFAIRAGEIRANKVYKKKSVSWAKNFRSVRYMEVQFAKKTPKKCPL